MVFAGLNHISVSAELASIIGCERFLTLSCKKVDGWKTEFFCCQIEVTSSNMKHTIDWFVSVQILCGVFSSSRVSCVPLVFLPHVQKEKKEFSAINRSVDKFFGMYFMG